MVLAAVTGEERLVAVRLWQDQAGDDGLFQPMTGASSAFTSLKGNIESRNDGSCPGLVENDEGACRAVRMG